MASIIPLIVLLLAAYSYSVPIKDQQYHSLTHPTSDYEVTTGKTIIDNEDKITMHLMSDEESTGIPKLHSTRDFLEHDDIEHTTSSQFENDDVSRPSRMIEDVFYTSSPMTFTDETPSDISRVARITDDVFYTSSPMTFTSEPLSSDISRGERSQNEFMFTTMSSDADLEHEHIHSDEHKSDVESKISERESEDKVDDLELTTITETITSVPFASREAQTSEPTTSNETFGKYTGILTESQTEETPRLIQSEVKTEQRPAPTVVHVTKHDDSSEELNANRPIKKVTYYPGKVTKTEIYTHNSNQK